MENIFNIANARFYLPNHEKDSIQRSMEITKMFWDMKAHNLINKYLTNNATIIDIGANIGSHSIYWGLMRSAKKVYAFEPFNETYGILKTNIELNNLQEVIIPNNFGLYSYETNARIMFYWEENLGGTSFTPDPKGGFYLKTLDSLALPDEKIDLIKIDVEGAEVKTLEGAINTIKKHKPIIVIESFKNKNSVEEILFPIGYKLIETIRENEDYIYIAD